jgi:hypothetical protein
VPDESIDIPRIDPEQAVADWIGSYLALLRAPGHLNPGQRRDLRDRYRKAKTVLTAILAARPGGNLVTRCGVYSLAVEVTTTTPYPVWRPHAKSKSKPVASAA